MPADSVAQSRSVAGGVSSCHEAEVACVALLKARVSAALAPDSSASCITPSRFRGTLAYVDPLTCPHVAWALHSDMIPGFSNAQPRMNTVVAGPRYREPSSRGSVIAGEWSQAPAEVDVHAVVRSTMRR
jgi:hypothetical protein